MEYYVPPPTQISQRLSQLFDWYDIYDTIEQAEQGFRAYPYPYKQEILEDLDEVLTHPQPEELFGRGIDLCTFLRFVCDENVFVGQNEDEARQFLFSIRTWLENNDPK
jgi:hypothetical protein